MSIILNTGHGEALTGLANGTFLTVWNGSGNTPTAQFFNTDGTKKGAPAALASGSLGENTHFSVANLSDGRFVVVWEQKDVKNSVYARIFDVGGNPVGDAFKINSADVAQTLPEVTALKNGGFAVATINEGAATIVLVDVNGVQTNPTALKAGASGISIAMLNNENLVSLIDLGSTGNYSIFAEIHEPDGTEYASGELIPSFNDADPPKTHVAALADGGSFSPSTPSKAATMPLTCITTPTAVWRWGRA